jgi:hypothetical protein
MQNKFAEHDVLSFLVRGPELAQIFYQSSTAAPYSKSLRRFGASVGRLFIELSSELSGASTRLMEFYTTNE